MANRQYADVALELPAVLNVLQMFDDYAHVSQVKNLIDKVEKIKQDLSVQVSADLCQMFKVYKSLLLFINLQFFI